MYNGALVFDKPQDFTSHDAVAKLRGMLKQRKIGHAGTLDPMATGVLIILLGNATRASEYAAAKTKEYEARLRLGVVTDTQDATGKVLETCAVNVGEEQVRQALEAFRGRKRQTPPMYSAVSVGGTRLYKLARAGTEVERDARDIEISRLELLGQSGENEYEIGVSCSKGTYIRTLCSDIGEALGCGACMSALRRTAIGALRVADALTFETVAERLQNGTFADAVLPTDGIFADLPAIILNETGEKRAENGAFFCGNGIESGEVPAQDCLCRVYSPQGEFLMLGRGGTLDIGGRAVFCHKTFFAREQL